MHFRDNHTHSFPYPFPPYIILSSYSHLFLLTPSFPIHFSLLLTFFSLLLSSISHSIIHIPCFFPSFSSISSYSSLTLSPSFRPCPPISSSLFLPLPLYPSLSSLSLHFIPYLSFLLNLPYPRFLIPSFPPYPFHSSTSSVSTSLFFPLPSLPLLPPHARRAPFIIT